MFFFLCLNGLNSSPDVLSVYAFLSAKLKAFSYINQSFTKIGTLLIGSGRITAMDLFGETPINCGNHGFQERDRYQKLVLKLPS